MKGLLTLLTLAGVCAGVFVLANFRRESSGKSLLNVAEEVAITVKVANPEHGEIIRLVQAPGDVEAVLEVDISSEIVSKIVEMPIEEGDIVKKGDLLCRLDDKYLLAEVESGEARIAGIRAGLVDAEAALEKAQWDYSRQLRLTELEATSDIELRNNLILQRKAGAMLDVKKAELAASQAGLKRISEDLKKTIITSPIDGVVSQLSAKQGEVVITGTMNNPGTVIMTISDLSKMQVRVRIDEMDVPIVLEGQKGRVYLQSDPDKPVPGRVMRVACKGTKLQGRDVVTFEALLEVLSPEARVMPGMTANVEIEVAKREDAITIPVEAVVHRMRKDLPDEVVKSFDAKQATLDLSERAKQGQYIKVVYVMANESAEVRLIEAGIADTRRVEIKEGVKTEDQIIVGPYRSLDQLKEGKKVALAEDEKKEADPSDSAEEAVASDDQDSTDKDQNEEATLAASSAP